MSWLQLLLKLAADLRSGNGEAKRTFILLFAELLGVQITLPPSAGTMSVEVNNEAADKIEAFIAEHNLEGANAQKLGDGVLLGKLIELAKLLIPLLIGLK